MKQLSILFLLLTLGVMSCNKDEGPGGKATIQGVAAHHSDPIPDTRVFIKYGTLLSPGLDPTAYDDSTVAGADGRFQFADLRTGEYYILGLGFDTNIQEAVQAGVPVQLEAKAEIAEIILPVTEE